MNEKQIKCQCDINGIVNETGELIDNPCPNNAINTIGDLNTRMSYYVCDKCYYKIFPNSTKLRNDSSFV